RPGHLRPEARALRVRPASLAGRGALRTGRLRPEKRAGDRRHRGVTAECDRLRFARIRGGARAGARRVVGGRISVRGAGSGDPDAENLSALAQHFSVHARKPPGYRDRFHQFRDQRGRAADRGQVRIRAGDGFRSRRAHRRGGTVNRAFHRVLPALVVGGLLAAAAAVYALSAGDIIKQGVEAYRGGNYKRALELFTQALRLDPGGAKPHYFIGSALEKLGEPDSAMAEYQTAVRIDPKYVEALTGLGNLLRKQGKLEEGTAGLQEAVKYNPKDPPALYALGQAYLKDKKWDQALAVFRKGTLLKQGRALFLDGVALALEGKGEIKQAEEMFIRARETDPNNLRVRLDLGGFYERKKIPVLAAPEYVKAAELDPKNPEAHYLAGRALVAMNEFNAGLSSFMRAIEVDSTFAPAYLEAGRLYFRANRPQDAADKFRAYTGFKPDDPEGYIELGRALAKSPVPG